MRGRYLERGQCPQNGLAVARMAAHITYMSDDALHKKFGRNLQDREKVTFGFDADFQVESYLRHQGSSFVDRFDANSYLYITRAMDYFDLAARPWRRAGQCLSRHQDAFLRRLVHHPTGCTPRGRAAQIVQALNAVAANCRFVEIESDKGHDAFLLEEPEFFDTVRGFINAAALKRGLKPAKDAA